MSAVATKFGVFQTPNINRLSHMNQGNALAPLVQSGNRSTMMPHVQTPIGAAGQSRAIGVRSVVYQSTNHMY